MAGLLKKMDGREYNSLNDAYFLPSDEAEWDRLDKQHIAFRVGLKALVPCPDIVDACLAPAPGITRKVLDLGSGTGVWAIDMAREYPHVSVVGVDLAPTPLDPASVPSNCRFEVDDVNLGLGHFYDQFDVVHARLISSGIKDYRNMMEEAEKCLKPGGVVVFVDYDAMFCAQDQVSRQPMAETNENGSWLVRCSHEMRHGAPLKGSDILGMEKCLDEGVWDHELLDPETAQAGSLFLPIGPWVRVPDPAKSEQMKFVGTIIRHDYTSAFRAVIPVFGRLGVPPEVVEKWKPHVEEELSSTTLRMWSRTRMAWGRRRTGPGEPAPPLPEIPPKPKEDTEEPEPESRPPSVTPVPISGELLGSTLRDYDWFHLYKTKEECVAAAKARNDSLGPVPTPWVLIMVEKMKKAAAAASTSK